MTWIYGLVGAAIGWLEGEFDDPDEEPERDASGAPAGDYWWVLAQEVITAQLNFNAGAGGSEQLGDL